MYFPLSQERVVLESSQQIWRVVHVDYWNEIVDLRAVTGPAMKLRGISFNRLMAVGDAFPNES